MRFDPQKILLTLRESGVRFLVIGGIAGTLHGSPYPTDDVDVCASDDDQNLVRLANALNSLEARERDPRNDTEVPFTWTAETLPIDKTWTLRTSYGHLDVLFEPAGTRGYKDLARQAVEYEFAGGPLGVVHVEDLIRMKEAVGRERDLEQLPTLRKLLEREP